MMWAVIRAVTVVRVCGLGWSGTSGMMACRSRRDPAAPACRADLRLEFPYVRVMILPGSWAGMLERFRPVFARRGTFLMFTVLATGMVAATGRRSVVGMLAGARMAQRTSFHAACRFFSSAVWDIDRLGLPVAGQVGRDVAELPAVGHDGFAEVGPALGDVGGDPGGDGAAGLRAGMVGHVLHDGLPRRA